MSNLGIPHVPEDVVTLWWTEVLTFYTYYIELLLRVGDYVLRTCRLRVCLLITVSLPTSISLSQSQSQAYMHCKILSLQIKPWKLAATDLSGLSTGQHSHPMEHFHSLLAKLAETHLQIHGIWETQSEPLERRGRVYTTLLLLYT